MPRVKGVVTKNVYVEVSDELWAKIKIHCFNKKKTLKEFVTKLIEGALK